MSKDYDDYIVFLLGADEFAISQYIREQGERFGMDKMYKCCVRLAQKFDEFDKDEYNIYSQYESFEFFLDEYFDEIIDFIDNDKDFEIKKGE